MRSTNEKTAKKKQQEMGYPHVLLLLSIFILPFLQPVYCIHLPTGQIFQILYLL